MRQSTLNLSDLTTSNPIACAEQPQNRFDAVGAHALSDSELIALLLNNGGTGRNALALARELIGHAGSIAALATWTMEDYQKFKGIGRGKARQLAVFLEVGRRIMVNSSSVAPVLNRPDLVMAHLAPIVRGLEVEKFWVLCLNRKNRLKRLVEVTSGTATSSLAHPREVFRMAIQCGATAIICAHNHPSGDPAPSTADIQVTRQLRDASKAVDIELLDHVVVGAALADPRGAGYYSFREAGML